MLQALLWCGAGVVSSFWLVIIMLAVNAYRREHGHICWICEKHYPCVCVKDLDSR